MLFNNKETAAPAMKPSTGPVQYEVFMGQGAHINGNISINGCTRIDGTIEGSLAVDSDLYIGESGVIKCPVYTQSANIAGTVNGNIFCKTRLELLPTAKVVGNIKCGSLIIHEGAVFRGNCTGFDNQPVEVLEPGTGETEQ